MLNEKVHEMTKLIQTVCQKHPKDNEKQYKAFMFVLLKVNPNFQYSITRYVSLRNSLAMYMFDKDASSQHEYEQKIHELLGYPIPILLL